VSNQCFLDGEGLKYTLSLRTAAFEYIEFLSSLSAIELWLRLYAWFNIERFRVVFIYDCMGCIERFLLWLTESRYKESLKERFASISNCVMCMSTFNYAISSIRGPSALILELGVR